ncbi:MAG: 30S ribosomal protein S8 [Candidatus Cloacimonetes bacterium]|nr:30S ribosomal protein S8 [Candidatus Cloacimonadota bacterium]MBL7085528.1 30S ribosomal protein S8 [Candidatus Cloacimonadota bacterium]
MPSTDTIAHMLTVIRNGIHAKKKTVSIYSSNMRKEIARILAEENFIINYKVIEKSFDDNPKFEKLEITLRYLEDNESFIRGLKRVSKPGKRIYVNSQNIPVVQNHLGIAIISTNKGVITDAIARKENIGGEYLCQIW